MKRLTKKEAEKISRKYNLGKVLNCELIKAGWVNYNHDLKTEKGNFIIRFIGKTYDKKKKEALKLEFKVLNHLKEDNFPYETPLPLKNLRGVYISFAKRKPFWVYPKIEGECSRGYSQKRIKELGKAMATYHKFVTGIRVGKDCKWNYGEIQKNYLFVRGLRPENKLDKLVKENVEMMEGFLHRVEKMNFKENSVPIHGDFRDGNLIWKGDKIVGIIDFDNIRMGPRVRDISYFIKTALFDKDKIRKVWVNLFLKEYEKASRLNAKEMKTIFPLLIDDNVFHYALFYGGCGKESTIDKQVGLIKWLVDTSKGSARELGWLKDGST